MYLTYSKKLTVASLIYHTEFTTGRAASLQQLSFLSVVDDGGADVHEAPHTGVEGERTENEYYDAF